MTDTDSNAPTRNQRRTLVGRVTSNASQHTITVLVERTFKHAKYGKFVRKNKRYHAHDEQQVASVGDMVEIVATRPISKLKRWRLVRVVDAAPVADLDAKLMEQPGAVEGEA